MMVTHVSVEYEVLFAVVVLDTLYRSCRFQLLVLLVIVPADYVIIVGHDRFCCLRPSFDFLNDY